MKHSEMHLTTWNRQDSSTLLNLTKMEMVSSILSPLSILVTLLNGAERIVTGNLARTASGPTNGRYGAIQLEKTEDHGSVG